MNLIYCGDKFGHKHSSHHKINNKQPKGAVIKRTTLYKHQRILQGKIMEYTRIAQQILRAAYSQRSSDVRSTMKRAVKSFLSEIKRVRRFRRKMKRKAIREKKELKKVRKQRRKNRKVEKAALKIKVIRALRRSIARRLSIRFRSYLNKRRIKKANKSLEKKETKRKNKKESKKKQSKKESELAILEAKFERRRGFGKVLSRISKKASKKIGKKLKVKITSKMKKKAKKFVQSWDEKKLAETCSKSFFNSLPPTFCWKRGADFGIIPTGCPPGYFRHLALCFRRCRPGWSFDGGALCIKHCPREFTTYPLTCTYWTWRFWEIRTIGREPYFPHSITNFDAPCQDGYYRMGALCYRDCANIGMENCGIGMCAASGDACTEGIIGMITDFLSGLGKAVGFILSFGSSSAASGEIGGAKMALKKLGPVAKKAIKNSSKIIKRIAKNKKLRRKILNKVKSEVKNSLKEFVMNGKQKDDAEQVCDQVSEGLMDRMNNSNSSGFDFSSIDVLGVGDVVNSCSNIKDSNGGVGCAESILNMLDTVDPTVLAGMAAAFMQPVCDI